MNYLKSSDCLRILFAFEGHSEYHASKPESRLQYRSVRRRLHLIVGEVKHGLDCLCGVYSGNPAIFCMAVTNIMYSTLQELIL